MTMVMNDKTVMPRRELTADAAVERAFAAATKDAGQVSDLLEALSRGRLWLPLADDGRPVTDGSAVNLPTLIYLGCEFVPAYTSADRLLRSARPAAQLSAMVPHVVVPAAALARLLPPALGIAVNPGGQESVPVYPDGVAYLAAARAVDVAEGISVGPPPAEPGELLAAIRFGLGQVRAAREAATAWLSVKFGGAGLVISVALDDPGDPAAQRAVLDVVERAASAAPGQPFFPIDVTFPGEGEPDAVDQWVAASATPFYSRP
jgi:SseB protein N-terminal domain